MSHQAFASSDKEVTMYQEFNEAHKVHVNRDDKGVARELLHTEEHFVSQAHTPQLAAACRTSSIQSSQGLPHSRGRAGAAQCECGWSGRKRWLGSMSHRKKKRPPQR